MSNICIYVVLNSEQTNWLILNRFSHCVHTQDDSSLVYSDDTTRTYTLCGAVFSSIALHIYIYTQARIFMYKICLGSD